MTRDEAVDLILSRLTRRSGDTDLVADIILEMKLAQTMTFERGPIKPWFLLTNTTAVIDGTGLKAPLPANFLHIYEQPGAVMLVGSTGANNPMEKVGPIESLTPYSALGTVTAYDIDEDYIQFASALTVGDSIRLIYYKTDEVLDSAYGGADANSTNLWLTHAADLIVAEVCLVIAELKLKYDPQRLQTFAARQMSALKRLQSDTISREEAARIRLMAGGPYPVIGAVRA